jgi:hypothetical protein
MDRDARDGLAEVCHVKQGLLVGVATGLPVEALTPWWRTALAVGVPEVVLISQAEDAYRLDPEAVTIREAKLREAGEGVCVVARTRWRAVERLLAGYPEDRPALVTDVRDVVFQRDPFVGWPADRLLVQPQTQTHQESPWALGWLDLLAPKATLRDELVVNAGVVGGPAGRVRRLAQLLATQTPPVHCTCTTGAVHMADQTILNVALRNGMAQDWALPPVGWCVHGRGCPPLHSTPEGRLALEDGTIPAIVHQYDVLPGCGWIV